MRVLWIGGFGLRNVNDKSKSGYNGGGWLASLQKEVMKRSDVTLGLVFCRDSAPQKVIQDGITHYVVSNYHKSKKEKLIDLLEIGDSMVSL